MESAPKVESPQVPSEFPLSSHLPAPLSAALLGGPPPSAKSPAPTPHSSRSVSPPPWVRGLKSQPQGLHSQGLVLPESSVSWGTRPKSQVPSPNPLRCLSGRSPTHVWLWGARPKPQVEVSNPLLAPRTRRWENHTQGARLGAPLSSPKSKSQPSTRSVPRSEMGEISKVRGLGRVSQAPSPSPNSQVVTPWGGRLKLQVPDSKPDLRSTRRDGRML